MFFSVCVYAIRLYTPIATPLWLVLKQLLPLVTEQMDPLHFAYQAHRGVDAPHASQGQLPPKQSWHHIRDHVRCLHHPSSQIGE